MRIETLCTGDELLTGLTSDTNSRLFQELLLDRCGLVVRRGVVVGDDRNDIIEALNAAVDRADIVLVSGGLGPTSDDITVDCAAAAAGVPVIYHPEALAHLDILYRERNIALTDVSRRQARVPEGAAVVMNPAGASPLFIQKRGACTLFFVPGVPREYRALVEKHVVPHIEALAKKSTTRRLLLLNTLGLPESVLAEKLEPVAARYPEVTFGYRLIYPEVQVKLLAEAPSAAQAEALIAQARPEVVATLGKHLLFEGNDSLPEVVHRTLLQRGERVAVAESCTGGRVMALLTQVAGASATLYGGAVVYTEAAKHAFASVPDAILAAHGAVSAPCAEALAAGIRERSGAHWGLSVTGFAGPDGGTVADPVGTVYIAVASAKHSSVKRFSFRGLRDIIQRAAAATALDQLRREL